MGWIWDLFFIMTITVLLLNLILRQLIPTRFGTLILLLLVLFRALGRGRGGLLGRLIRRTFALGIPLTSLLIFAVVYSQGDPDQMITIIGELGVLLIALFGIYIMVRGLFARSRLRS